MSWFVVAFICFAMLAGGCLGSFLGALWSRRRLLAAGAIREALFTRSMCDGCLSPIPAARNVPFLGWLAGRGRAGCCGRRIPVSALMWELTFGGLCALGAALHLLSL